MSVLNSLIPEFRAKVETLMHNCAAINLDMRPTQGLRNPYDQARYWRQSRSSQTVADEIAYLQSKGAHFLAHVIQSVGPQNGPHVTNAIPGLSWHQWGEAIDFAWFENGHEVPYADSVVNGRKGYELYAQEAKKLDLEAGYFWGKFQDGPHVQLSHAASPLVKYSLIEIDAEMQKRFGA